MERLVYFGWVDTAVLVCENVPEPDCSDECFRRLLVEYTFLVEKANGSFRGTALVAEITGCNVLSEVQTCLNGVFEHSLDRALLSRTLKELATREGLLFFRQLGVVLFDLFEFDRNDALVSHGARPPRCAR